MGVAKRERERERERESWRGQRTRKKERKRKKEKRNRSSLWEGNLYKESSKESENMHLQQRGGIKGQNVYKQTINYPPTYASTLTHNKYFPWIHLFLKEYISPNHGT